LLSLLNKNMKHLAQHKIAKLLQNGLT